MQGINAETLTETLTIGGNKVTIKTPLIATRYHLIIKELSISVANVALN